MPEVQPSAVLDANVLANIHVCDLLLRLAEEPALYAPLWSERILDEVQRTHSKLTWNEEISDHWRREVQRAFPDSTISDFEDLEEQIEVDLKDRHVAATAVKGGATLIVTSNLRDFPASGLDRWNLEAVHPSDFLIQLTKSNPELVRQRLAEYATRRRCSVPELLNRLNEWIGGFTECVKEADSPTE